MPVQLHIYIFMGQGIKTQINIVYCLQLQTSKVFEVVENFINW